MIFDLRPSAFNTIHVSYFAKFEIIMASVRKLWRITCRMIVWLSTLFLELVSDLLWLQLSIACRYRVTGITEQTDDRQTSTGNLLWCLRRRRDCNNSPLSATMFGTQHGNLSCGSVFCRSQSGLRPQQLGNSSAESDSIPVNLDQIYWNGHVRENVWDTAKKRKKSRLFGFCKKTLKT